MNNDIFICQLLLVLLQQPQDLGIEIKLIMSLTLSVAVRIVRTVLFPVSHKP